MSLVLPESVIQTCRTLAQPLLYVATVNHRYRNACRKLLEDWNRLGVTNGCVICLDETIWGSLGQQFPTVPLFYVPYAVQKPDNVFWSFRLQVLTDLLAAQIPTVMVDVDTEWHQNPTDYILQQWADGADLLVSQGRDYPEPVYKQQGFTLCSGVLAAQPTVPVLEFMEDWLQLTASVADDDVALNRLLSVRSVGAQFSFPRAALQGRALRGLAEPVPGTWHRTNSDQIMSLKVLPWTLFPRAALAQHRDQILVAHYHERKW